MIVLRLRSDAGERDLSFAGDAVRIGRKADNEVVLADDRSSRHHARIEKAGEGYVLVDLGSQNGTLVGGRRIDRHALRVGDEIRIGATTLAVVSLGGAAVPPDPAPAPPPAAAEAGPVAVADAPAPPAATPAAPRIVLALRGEGEAREAAFEQDAIRIGRSAENDIVLADAKSSRCHARIETAAGERVLVDLGSHNGTLVGGRKVSRHVLRAGDEIRIGMTTLTVVSLGAAAAPAAPAPVSPASPFSAPTPPSGEASAPAGTGAAPPASGALPVAEPVPAVVKAGDTRTRDVRARGRRPSRLASLASAAAFLLLFGGAGYYLLQVLGPTRPPRSPERPPGLGGVPEPEPGMSDGADPAWKALGTSVNDALGRGRFDEALAAVSAFRDRHPGATGGELEALDARIQAGAEADVRRVLERGGALEKERQADAAGGWYAGELPRFRGTRAEAALQERLRAGRDLAAAAAKVPAAAETRPVAAEPPRPADPVASIAPAARGLDVAALAGALAVAPTAEAASRSFEAVLAAWRRPDLPEAERGELRSRALEALRRNREDRVAALLGGKTPVLAGQLAAMKKELNRRREKAIKAVCDPVFFPAAGAASDDPARGWRGVDRVVESVREAWDRPLVLVLDPRVGREVSDVLVSAGACAAALEPAFGTGVGAAEGPADGGGLNGAVAASFRSFSLDGPEGAVYAWNRRVERYNRGLGAEIGADVRELAALVNDYREMMGLRRCVIDPRLCRSSRKRAAACAAAGKTGDAGPDGTPKSRAEAEGFRGAAGDWATLEPGTPRDLWEKVWYRSGDAHRAALKETWNSIGFGRDGRAAVLSLGNAIPPEGL